VANRWHLMKNASHQFLGAVRKSIRQINLGLAPQPSIQSS